MDGVGLLAPQRLHGGEALGDPGALVEQRGQFGKGCEVDGLYLRAHLLQPRQGGLVHLPGGLVAEELALRRHGQARRRMQGRRAPKGSGRE